MKFVCLGYLDEATWGTLGAAKQEQMMAACTDYDIELHRKGHYADGMALQSATAATTVRWRDGKAIRTDGPFAETKELLGGILILEAKDREEAVGLIMRHPGIRMGGFEVRPADEEFMAQHPVMKQLKE